MPIAVVERCRAVMIEEIRRNVLALQVAAIDDAKALDVLSVVPQRLGRR
jgi:hypothetical protein